MATASPGTDRAVLEQIPVFVVRGEVTLLGAAGEGLRLLTRALDSAPVGAGRRIHRAK
ncbi:MAG TPA: hypothetical protein VFD49_16885 [Candidatus Dormibacteraeota bacterium]|nr:hypothetical protein [Candidatus Dormibacteraeota bacterium]